MCGHDTCQVRQWRGVEVDRADCWRVAPGRRMRAFDRSFIRTVVASSPGRRPFEFAYRIALAVGA
ncbi:hypothetical protein WT60_06300 [Burkholderia sp. MSMB617WGS]|uniref:Transposase n=1 Tax=Burkholderia savannae TaxID=1637837 RepID=A0ABR5TBV3_9BURK|nr:hypothetical protein WS86_06335 [Burkholderia savannae]AOK46503.1 hypothetical protein WT60_06300 [Burkholderia sp. MSMB617WGS]KWZ42488.1 hypothetical protein WS72_06105 [Burkholderia savannae]